MQGKMFTIAFCFVSLAIVDNILGFRGEIKPMEDQKELKQCGCDTEFIKDIVAATIAKELRRLTNTNVNELKEDELHKRALRPFYLV